MIALVALASHTKRTNPAVTGQHRSKTVVELSCLSRSDSILSASEGLYVSMERRNC